MATETTELTLGAVRIEDDGPANKTLTIEVPADVIESRLNQGINSLMQSVRFPGFRPGKAPRRLVEKRLGADLEKDTTQRLVSEAYRKVIADNKLKVLGEPVLKSDVADLVIRRGQPLTFSLEVEVLPDFDLPKFEGIKVRRPLMDVTPELIEQEINAQRERRGRLQDRDGKPEPGDYLFGMATFFSESGEEIRTVDEAVSRVPVTEDKGMGILAGVLVEGLVETLAGKGVGDTVDVQTTGPENHEIVEIRDKPIRITFEIASVRRLMPLELEDLIRMAGVRDEQELRDRVSQALAQQIDAEQKDVMRRQIMRYLLDNSDVPVPQRASAAQAERIFENARIDLLSRGMTELEIEEHVSQLRSASQEQTQRDMKLTLITSRLANELDVQVTEEEVNGHIAMMARQQGVRPAALQQELAQSNRIMLIVGQVRQQKALDHLISMAEIEDVSAEDWNTQMQAEEAGESAPAEEAAAKPKKKTAAKGDKASGEKSASKSKTTKGSKSKKAD